MANAPVHTWRLAGRLAAVAAAILALGLYAAEVPAVAVRDTPAAAASPVAERVLAEARRIMTTMRSSRYSHTTKVDEKAGSYAVDCSGLVAIILKTVAPEHLAAIPKDGRARPRAVEFHDAFVKAGEAQNVRGWQRVPKLMDARPGDLIAWRKKEIEPGESTGHIMVVAEPPVQERRDRVRVAIIDSTSTQHGDDTREGTDHSIGQGTVWFEVDEQGQPTGYRWRSRSGSLHRPPIAIGRAIANGN
jgi:hypothetical protein